MATLTIDETVLTLTEDDVELLTNNRAIVETDTDEYRLSTFDEMYGTPGSPIRAPESLYNVTVTLALLEPAA